MIIIWLRINKIFDEVLRVRFTDSVHVQFQS